MTIGIIPAAGRGERMKPFTRANPKELYHIDRKAVIDHAVEILHDNGGIEKIIVIVGAHKSSIMDHLGNGGKEHTDLHISYLFQEELLGLAHAIYQAKPWIQEDFVVHLGDSFIHPKSEIKKLISLHTKEKPFATIMYRTVEDPRARGTLKISGDDLINAIEKPTWEQAEPYKLENGKYAVICGLYYFSTKIFEYIEDTKPGAKGELQITDSIKLALEKGETIKAVPLKGRYNDIGNWDDVEDVEEFFRKLRLKKYINEL